MIKVGKEMLSQSQLEDNPCEVCGEKPPRTSENVYTNKTKDLEPIPHYTCSKHILDIYNKLNTNEIEELVIIKSNK
jgi:hypothetical protein